MARKEDQSKEDRAACFEPEKTGGRQHNGQFKPGVSGNPLGRPAGRRNKATELLEAMLVEDWQAVAKGLLDAAKKGNASAARVVLDRVAPKPRGRTVALELPPVETVADVDKALNVVLAGIGGGTVTPSEGATISGILEAKRRVLVSTLLDERVQKIEGALDDSVRH